MLRQAKMKKSVVKAYNERAARMQNRTAGGRIHDVAKRKVGSNPGSRAERLKKGMLLWVMMKACNCAGR